MTDRKDYAKEIAAALRAGDLDAMFSVAMELAAREALYQARLEADAGRKRRSRHTREVTGQNVTGRDDTAPAPFSPRPPFSSPTTSTASSTARGDDAVRVAAAKADLVIKLGGGVEAVASVDQFAAEIPTVKAFPWLVGMATWLKPITGGKGHSPDVMLAAMTDWLIADRAFWPWEGRKFRSFMRDIERQREQMADVKSFPKERTPRPTRQNAGQQQVANIKSFLTGTHD